MSGEFAMAQAMEKLAAVNAISAKQKQEEMERSQESKDRGTEIHWVTHALQHAVFFHQRRPDSTIEMAMEDADKMLKWFQERKP